MIVTYFYFILGRAIGYTASFFVIVNFVVNGEEPGWVLLAYALCGLFSNLPEDVEEWLNREEWSPRESMYTYYDIPMTKEQIRDILKKYDTTAGYSDDGSIAHYWSQMDSKLPSLIVILDNEERKWLIEEVFKMEFSMISAYDELLRYGKVAKLRQLFQNAEKIEKQLNDKKSS